MKVSSVKCFGLFLVASCFLIGLGGVACQGQSGGGWVPFTATQEATVYSISGGQKKLENKRVGPFVRDVNGSIFNRMTYVSGPASGQAGAGVLQDRRTGITYEINYSARRATIVSQPPSGGWTPPSPSTEASFRANRPADLYLGTKTINGIECEGWRYLPSPLTGEAWYAPSLNYAPILIEYIDNHRSPPAEADFSLENIQVGKVPDSSLFKVPAGFAVVTR